VFLRDPIAGDGWRGRANAGPYSFGVRSISARSQVMLSDRDGTNFQLTTDNLSFDSTGTTRLLLGADQRGARIWLADSTGSMQLLNAPLLADAAAKRSPKPGPAPKHRRRH
jgi:hypothetical protein